MYVYISHTTCYLVSKYDTGGTEKDTHETTNSSTHQLSQMLKLNFTKNRTSSYFVLDSVSSHY